MEKTVIKFGDIQIEKQKPHLHKRPISMAIKMIKLDLYVYFSQN